MNTFTLCHTRIFYFVSYEIFYFVSYENEGGITFMSFNAKGRGLASEEEEDEDLGKKRKPLML